MEYLVLLLTIVLASTVNCGNNSNTIDTTGFESYYMSFVVETGKPAKNLIIKFGDNSDVFNNTPNTVVIGSCRPGSIPTVIIDKSYWDSHDEYYRHELIYHELGHCILYRGHDNTTLIDGKPSSIMNSKIFDPVIIKQNHDYYIHELVMGGANDH